MLKAAFITPGAYPIPSTMGGSVERVVEKVVPKLLPYADARIYGRLGKRLPSRGSINGVQTERFPAVYKTRYLNRVCVRLKHFQPQIIQVENRPLWIPRLKRAFPHRRIGLNLHSTTFICKPYMNKLQRRRCLQAADYIQVNSEYLQAYLKEHIPQVAEKIIVNHLGVDVDRFPVRASLESRSMREQLRAVKGWGDRPIVLYVGRLVPQKGVHHLISTITALKSIAPNVLVVIVGSAMYGSHRQTGYVRRLYKQAERWKKHVYFQPYVSHDQIPRWFATADIAVVPSVGKEAFGLVNLEAMAAELPIVATKAGGIKEIVEDGLTGFLVAPQVPFIVAELTSRLCYLLANPDVRKVMGSKGRERVMNYFLWEHTANRWLDFQRE
ncbi:glycosyltransferase family 4 protein [Cohnella sp.]|uniref:glycosyltransferase family 4 protein n=1 Tax=Cohnella sp. TaxID=1883426 RepID=UPI00356AE20B